MKVKFLKANNGDAIHISYVNNDKNINILIDSGTRESYSKIEKEQRAPRKEIIIDGEFKKLNRLIG